MNSFKGNFFITFYTAGSRTEPCVVFIKVPVAVVDVVVEQLSCPGVALWSRFTHISHGGTDTLLVVAALYACAHLTGEEVLIYDRPEEIKN